MDLKLKAAFRPKLREPFGTLLQPGQAVAEARRKPAFIITVGDVSTAVMLEGDIRPHVAIVDFKTIRGPIEPKLQETIGKFEANVYRAVNKPGTISQAAMATVSHAVLAASKGNCHCLIIIQGEEDLLAFEALSQAPVGALLFYGQPNAGMVMLEATPSTKAAAEKLKQEAFDKVE